MEILLNPQNDSLLKKAKVLLTLAYICSIIFLLFNYFFSWELEDYLIQKEIISFDNTMIYNKLVNLITGGIYAILISMAMLKFIKYGNHNLKSSAYLLFIAVWLPLILRLFPAQVMDSAELLKFNYQSCLFALLFALIEILAYKQLLNIDSIKKHHPEVYILFLVPSTMFMFTISTQLLVWQELNSCDFEFINGTRVLVASERSRHITNIMSDLGVISLICQILLYLFSILSWVGLLKTPSDIPVTSEFNVKKAFAPGKVEIGFATSLLLFCGCLYLIISYLL